MRWAALPHPARFIGVHAVRGLGFTAVFLLTLVGLGATSMDVLIQPEEPRLETMSILIQLVTIFSLASMAVFGVGAGARARAAAESGHRR